MLMYIGGVHVHGRCSCAWVVLIHKVADLQSKSNENSLLH